LVIVGPLARMLITKNLLITENTCVSLRLTPLCEREPDEKVPEAKRRTDLSKPFPENHRALFSMRDRPLDREKENRGGGRGRRGKQPTLRG